ncbi:MAG: hypothetical protein AVDCRST_MAG02-352, partial [uncultured Rubrobacteraceae bacterium]
VYGREQGHRAAHLRGAVGREGPPGRGRAHRRGRPQLRYRPHRPPVRPRGDEGHRPDGHGGLPGQPPRGAGRLRRGRSGHGAGQAYRHARGQVHGHPAHGSEDRGKRDPRLPPAGRQGRRAPGGPRRPRRDAPTRRHRRRGSRPRPTPRWRI